MSSTLIRHTTTGRAHYPDSSRDVRVGERLVRVGIQCGTLAVDAAEHPREANVPVKCPMCLAAHRGGGQ